MFGAHGGDVTHPARRYGPQFIKRVRKAKVRSKVQSSRRDAKKAINGAIQLMITHIETAMHVPDAESFHSYWRENWDEFHLAFRLFGEIADKLASRSAELREHLSDTFDATVDGCVEALGGEAAAEVRFATHTLESATRLVRRMDVLESSGHAPRDLAKDKELAALYSVACAWHSVGFNCVSEVVDRMVTPAAEVTHAAVEMMRTGALEAYHAATEGLRLRVPAEDSDAPSVVFDDDDLSLANEQLSDAERLIRNATS